ncbi:hypothetical protein [Bifidobacterium sp. SO1]|uniref:hypothetical protein n=1 Tax=Bifidobacterium sp. SO1 TaxID=2809029 RepID=UPI001BDD2423|nr:hypothetical protein [Bifidobacterium sp. SO1]MBT1161837.1 hypothetical protein [Bifidobacterium sp. SO1]
MEDKRQTVGRWTPMIGRLRDDWHLHATIVDRQDDLALFGITMNRRPTIWIKTRDRWEDDLGRTGRGPAQAMTLILHDKADDIRRILHEGDERSRIKTLLDMQGCDASRITRIRHDRDRTIIDYKTRRGLDDTITLDRNPDRMLNAIADRLDAYDIV